MRYLALATDYDGTLATNSYVDPDTLAALKRLKESRRKLILATGQQLEDLCQVFPEADGFDCIVAENGAYLYFPETRETKALGEAPSEAFVQALQARNVEPLDDKCFYVRGEDAKLNLKAQNLMMFMQLADGVDEHTWTYHLEQQDYSGWFREAIKDETLAEIAAGIETSELPAAESRDRIKAAINQRYTLPA